MAVEAHETLGATRYAPGYPAVDYKELKNLNLLGAEEVTTFPRLFYLSALMLHHRLGQYPF
jgi:hypothetical protein